MSLVKVIEVIAEGKSIEHTIENALEKASKTIHGIKSIYVKDVNAMIENNQIEKYRLIVKISFVLDGQ